MKVIVVGSGIAGLSAAIALRKVGADVTLYERAPELREVGAGISLWANAIRALDAIGAGEEVRRVSLPMVRSELRADEGRRVLASVRASRFEEHYAVRPFMAMTHRAELVAALARCLPGDIARYGHECVGIDATGERPIVRFANGHKDEGDVVIGADGIHSVIRAALFGPDEPRYSGYTGWRGVCPRPTSIEPGYVGEWWGRGRRFGITTLPGDRVYWFATHNTPAGGRSPDERAALLDLFRTWADPLLELITSTPPDKILRNDIVDRPPIPKWSIGRVGLIGDAAHPTTPNLGQGGCLAIEDSVSLARVLTAQADPAHALESFSAGRRQRTTAVNRESWRLGQVAQWEGRISCWLRNRLFGVVLPLVGARSFTRYASFDVGTLLGSHA